MPCCGDRGRGDAWRRPGKVLRLLVRPGVPLMRPGVPLVRPCVPLVRPGVPLMRPCVPLVPLGVPLVRPCGVPYPPCVSLGFGSHCLRFRLPHLWRGGADESRYGGGPSVPAWLAGHPPVRQA